MAASNSKISASLNGDTSTILIIGRIDEDSLDELIKLQDTLGSKVIIDFGGVTKINSIGIRDWVKFIRLINAKHTISFIRCPDEIVGSIAMVRQFAEKATVQSLNRTYTCEQCDLDSIHTLERGKHFDSTGKVGSFVNNCTQCSAQLTAVTPDDEYFIFLQNP